MFYAHIILAKKGPLARVWLAAHWDKKITKAHVFETNIEQSVEGIMQPKVKLALRTSGHLLLGVVRIYSRKAKYLLADCNEAFVKIKMAFRPGMVDLPEGHREANVNAITLPEVFHDFDTALPELNDIDLEAQFSVNQSRADEITMREDYGSLSLSLHDDGFGDIGFEGDTPDLVRASLDTNLNDQLFQDDCMANTALSDNHISKLPDADVSSSRLEVDGFGDEFGQPQLFEDDLFGEPTTHLDATKEVPLIPASDDFEDFDARDDFDNHAPSPGSSCHDFSAHIDNADVNDMADATKTQDENDDNEKNAENEDQATLLRNEDESFALAPIDASAYKGVTKPKRKRKLIVDEIKNISGEEMKSQLANTSDIVTTLDLAPPTKRLMYWKETGGVEKLFSLPSRHISASVLFVNYSRHLISRFTQLEDFSSLDPHDLLSLDQVQTENEPPSTMHTKRGRKRKGELLPLVPAQHESTAETTNQSLAPPEPMRENESTIAERTAVEIGGQAHDSLIPPNVSSNMFDAIRSPGPIFLMNEMNAMDNLASLNEIPLTPGIDTCDDFHHGDMTPAELNHGHMTPQHSGIESIESIPNIPADQISSILNEAENMCKGGDSISADWNEYDNLPVIQGIQCASEEQLENETDEQFEERVLNKRAAQLFFAVKSRMVKQECLLLSELTVRNTRKQAAQKFYSLLVLKKFRALNIIQSSPYSDINISRGPLFENPKL